MARAAAKCCAKREVTSWSDAEARRDPNAEPWCRCIEATWERDCCAPSNGTSHHVSGISGSGRRPGGRQEVYEAVYELDDNGKWFVRAPEVAGAHSHGRTLARARANIREAISLASDVEDNSFDLKDVIHLPDPVRRRLTRAREARRRAEKALASSVSATREAVDVLSSPPFNLSLRDVADLLGVSFQRVQQMRSEARSSESEDAGPPREVRSPAPGYRGKDF
jgi:predicted RNase H-like HicB family nuclease